MLCSIWLSRPVVVGRRLLNIRRRGGKTDLLDRRWRRRGDRSRHPPSDHYLSPRRSRHGIIRIGLATSGNRGCVCVCVCVCCGLVAAARQKTVCVYITEYNRNVIPLAGISPSRLVGTPYLLSRATTYCRRSRRHHHHTNRHTVARSTPLHSPLARHCVRVRVCVFICVYYIYIYTHTHVHTYTYIYIYIYCLLPPPLPSPL